jgi:ferredoxin
MCTVCLRCVEMCPEKDCISIGFGKLWIYGSRNWLEEKK